MQNSKHTRNMIQKFFSTTKENTSLESARAFVLFVQDDSNLLITEYIYIWLTYNRCFVANTIIYVVHKEKLLMWITFLAYFSHFGSIYLCSVFTPLFDKKNPGKFLRCWAESKPRHTVFSSSAARCFSTVPQMPAGGKGLIFSASMYWCITHLGGHAKGGGHRTDFAGAQLQCMACARWVSAVVIQCALTLLECQSQ